MDLLMKLLGLSLILYGLSIPLPRLAIHFNNKRSWASLERCPILVPFYIHHSYSFPTLQCIMY